ncbi:hypothetical protein QQS21_001935 [Conoideocrella luteorostrata]|uniref:Cytochrome P450 n=1 Tax=Conoideocrella luteorostrata TaxID=1105319 RepID=A0AAJ0CWA9_9HYPO|nr:hypothetical protein QQS21_001935 [Conoideocrella luteorostrata]
MIEDLYSKSNGKAFAVPAIAQFQVLVTNPKHLLEVARCPESIMSFHNAMKERLRHKTTMLGFEHNDIDPNEYVTMQVVKVHLRKNLGVMSPLIERAVARGFESKIQGAAEVTLPVFDLAKAVIGQVNNEIFFGSELSQNEEFSAAAVEYPWHGALTAEICRYLPEFVNKVIGNLLMAGFGSMSIVDRHLSRLVEARTEAHANNMSANYVDVTQFVITTSRTPRQRSHRRMVQLIAALLFAVSLSVPMALYWNLVNLCMHPDLVESLREEIAAAEGQDSTSFLKSMRLLDCFLRETARLNPPDALVAQRKTMQPYTFSDGTYVPAGNLVALPVRAVMRDAEYYPDPRRFDPYRFYTPDNSASSEPIRRFTDVNAQYPFWGLPTKSCPGRWYASDVLKRSLVHLLTNYDFEFAGPVNCEPLKVTTALAPRQDVMMKLRARKSVRKCNE